MLLGQDAGGKLWGYSGSILVTEGQGFCNSFQQYDTYSACIEALKNGAIDAVTTDEVILAGYAAQQPGQFKIVGDTFSEENYGIGLKKGDTELLTKINDALVKMEQDGSWKKAWEDNLGAAGIPAPEPPQINQS